MLLDPDAIRLSTNVSNIPNFNGFACLPCARQSRKRPVLQTRTNASLVMNTRYRQRQWRVYHMPIFALDNEVERIDNGAKLDSRTSTTYYLPDISAACFVRLSRTWTLRTRAPAACPGATSVSSAMRVHDTNTIKHQKIGVRPLSIKGQYTPICTHNVSTQTLSYRTILIRIWTIFALSHKKRSESENLVISLDVYLLCSTSLRSGSLLSRATDFGSGIARSSVWGSSVWGSRVWGSRVSG